MGDARTTLADMATEQLLDADTYLAEFCERNTELIAGRVVMEDAVLRHQLIVMNICTALRAWVASPSGSGLATINVDVRLTSHDVLKPDVLWYADPASAHLDAVQDAAPDLVVEVRSPSTWTYDVGPKLALYERRGVREAWLVDTPARTVLVHRRGDPGAARFDVHLEVDEDETLSSPMLPGLSLPLSQALRVS